MARFNHHVLVLVLVAVAASLVAAEASGVGFNLHHRSSEVVRRWAEARGHPLGAPRPAHGSPGYYSALTHHDRALLARRGLAGADGLLTFADGNDTYRFASLGFLYYAELSVGTPNATFLVALDTGSDLFWVPCDCLQCAPIANATGQGQGGPNLRPYSPRLSSTSKAVTCNHALCDRPNACGAAGNGSCPYVVRYVSANTSSSGVLVQDVLHLTREGPGAEAVQAPIVFGCGQVQTGAFLDGPAADGLLGLGMEKVSVPSVLASSGLVASDSFSMCFSPDGVGRINFGDAGSRDQAETPFIVSNTHPTYNVSFTSINAGSKSVQVEFAAVMDSGTSFTYLNDPEYTELATNVNSQIRERRANFSDSAGSIPFEYCYELSPSQTEVLRPEVSLMTKGGALFPVTRPFLVLADEINGEFRPVGYCLAILKNDISINIIGQNFMTGLKVVFDRQRSVLGWQKFDCYKSARAADTPDGSPNAAAGPTTLTPQQNGGNNRYPGAAPLPRSAGSRHGARALGGLSLLLPLLAAALV
ncbi:aspartyl protease family protein 1-like [Phragmites australis]|uniref:aspartyl protease family protein 1-like n=1 Tax=Phragmites australis TaxID=29695 RepID=UPI002D7996E0|nr:aspartyl protease family protein 1-like [Phragmites australis]